MPEYVRYFNTTCKKIIIIPVNRISTNIMHAILFYYLLHTTGHSKNISATSRTANNNKFVSTETVLSYSFPRQIDKLHNFS